MNKSTIAIILISATGLVAGCQSDSEKCDAGQVLKDAVCVAAQGGTTGTGTSTGGISAEGGTSSSPQAGASSAEGGTATAESSSGGATATGGSSSGATSTADLFGKDCTADGDCTAPVGYCAKMPGASSGYCTQQGCKTDASICPATWTCFDLAAVGVPNGPNFCQKPN